MPERAGLSVTVRGRVQRVSFRAFVAEAAAKRRITGYARNMADGSVKVEAEGDREALEELLTCLRTGPPGARVGSVEATWSAATNRFSGFQAL